MPPWNRPAIVKAVEDVDARYINAEHEAGKRSEKEALEHYLNAGRRLNEQKKKLLGDRKRGGWQDWLKVNIKFARSTAKRYMLFARRVDEGLTARNGLLTHDEMLEIWQDINRHSKEQPPEEDTTPSSGDAADIAEGEEEKYTETDEEDDEEDDTDNEKEEDELADIVNDQPVEEEVAGSVSPEEEESDPASNGKVPLQTIDALGEFVTLDRWKEADVSEKSEWLRNTESSTFNAQKNDNIEWALWSWNPVTGCRHDCVYCYARDIANRFYKPKFEPSLWPARLTAPRTTPFPTEKAKKWMGHKNVFVCSMADLFGRWVPREWIDRVLEECAQNTKWNFLFLTKFPNRMSEFEFSDNCWVGTTVDCQARVKNAEKSFRKVKAKVKWLSCEPLIEPLHFTDLGAFHWVVIGGASKSTQTPEWKPPFDWVASLWMSAKKAGCQVYFKTNLGIDVRILEYPGLEPEKITAPESLIYLPQEIG